MNAAAGRAMPAARRPHQVDAAQRCLLTMMILKEATHSLRAMACMQPEGWARGVDAVKGCLQEMMMMMTEATT